MPYWPSLFPRHVLFRLDARVSGTGPWPAIGWAYSLLLPIALVLLALTVAFAPPGEKLAVLVVTSSVSGEALPGALVSVGDTTYRTDDQGEVRIHRPADDVDVTASMDGYVEVRTPIRVAGDRQVIQMQPAMVSGNVRDAGTGKPIPGAVVMLVSGSGEQIISVRSDASGAWIFKSVPANASLRIQAAGYMDQELIVGARRRIDVVMDRAPFNHLGFQTGELPGIVLKDRVVPGGE